jgi:hypothetical protein
MVKNIDTEGNPVDESTHNEWIIEVDTGQRVMSIPQFSRARFVNTKRDMAFNLAQSPDGNFSNVTRVGGGGAVNILYSVSPTWRLWVGGVMQMRRNIADQPIFNLIRGYKRPNEDNLTAALREALEESGRDDLMAPILLPGQSINADSAVFDSVHGGGVDINRIEVPYKALIRNVDGTMGFNTQDLTEDQRSEGIYGVVFIDGSKMSNLAALADGFTLAGYLRLMAYLEEEAGRTIVHGEIREPYALPE